jgi:hypothetical protein
MLSFLDDNEEENQAQTTATAPAAGVPGNSKAVQAGPQARQARSSSSLPDIEKIQKLNEPKVQGTANSIVGNQNASLQSASNVLGNELNQYKTNAEGLRYNTDAFTGKNANQIDRNQFNQIARPDQDFSRGLANFQSAQGINAVNQANKDAQATASSAGRNTALQNLARSKGVTGYSKGENRLDSGLISSNSNALGALKQARDNIANQSSAAVNNAYGQSDAVRNDVIRNNQEANNRARQWYQAEQNNLRSSIAQGIEADRQRRIQAARQEAGANNAGDVNSLIASRPDLFQGSLDAASNAPLIDYISSLNSLGEGVGLDRETASTSRAPVTTSDNNQAIRDALASLSSGWKQQMVDAGIPKATTGRQVQKMEATPEDSVTRQVFNKYDPGSQGNKDQVRDINNKFHGVGSDSYNEKFGKLSDITDLTDKGYTDVGYNGASKTSYPGMQRDFNKSVQKRLGKK